jgi:chemotaxis protein methyltransferase CheR
MMSQAALSKEDFNKFASLIRKLTGIQMGDSKYELLYARLSSRLRALGLQDFGQYYDLVSKEGAGEELSHMVDQVTTNKTEFFRESRHFEHLAKTALPEWSQTVRAGTGKEFRLWCAAAATGEEPWTLAMTCLEALGDRAVPKIVPTDISMKALNKAAEGLYAAERIVGIPAELLRKYFQKGVNANGPTYTAGPELKAVVKYARLNLMMERFPFEKPFDVIFCRNVMIYFDRATQEALVNRLADKLQPQGYLYTGLSESLLAINHGLKAIAPSVYQKP